MHRVLILASLAVAFAGRPGIAACPPDCVGGGGPATDDCVVEWGGFPDASTALSCVDGSPCDGDGQADGVCVFPLAACLGVEPACAVSAVDSASVSPRKLTGGAALASAIRSLAPGQCTAPGFAVPVKWKPGTPGPIKAGTARLRVRVVADGRKDADVLTLTCEPARPALGAVVQPLFTSHCATAGCHGGVSPQVPDLDAGDAHGALVGQIASTGRRPYVTPGNTRRSWLVAKIIGARGTTRMPQGCGTPDTPCLTAAETYRVLAWIQAGAPND